MSCMGITISTDQLAQEIRQGGKNTILAAIWRPGEQQSLKKFQSEHIPTSLFCDPAASLAGTPGSKVGRNPLPTAEHLQIAFESWGINPERQVIVYDEGKGLFAARAWWILTWAGVADVKILDGGMAKWEKDGYQVVGGPGNLAGHCFTRVNPGQLPVATIDEVRSGDFIVVDTREANRYLGRKERLDLKAGHIPGAVNVPTRTLLNEDDTFASPDHIADRFAEAGVDGSKPVIVYSGSGIHASQAVAAMVHAGLPPAAIYMGGWSQWCANPANPVARG